MTNTRLGDPIDPIRRRILVRSGGAIAATAMAATGAGAVFRFGNALAKTDPGNPHGVVGVTPEVKLVDDYNAWFLGGAYLGDMDKLKAGLPAYITDETVLHEPVSLPWGGTWVGYQGWASLCQKSDPIFGRIAGRMEVSASLYYQSGNVVLHESSLTFKPIKSGELPFIMPVIEKYTIENGRIKQIDEFWADTASLNKKLKAMGALPKSKS